MPAIIILGLLIEHVSRYLLGEYINFSYNPGVAFGIMQSTPGFALILSGVACAMIILSCIFSRIKISTRIGLAVMSGGALSNFLERLMLGHVIDWIPFPFIDLNFNVADVEIALGALIVTWDLVSPLQ